MILQQIFEISNNQLVINLPDSFKNKQKVLVTVNDFVATKADKIREMQLAAKDPLFLKDIKEVNDDFIFSDNEKL